MKNNKEKIIEKRLDMLEEIDSNTMSVEELNKKIEMYEEIINFYRTKNIEIETKLKKPFPKLKIVSSNGIKNLWIKYKKSKEIS